MPGIKDFKDKVVVVTGAGSGIGRATAIAFAEEGANLVVADIRADRLDEAAGEISRRGVQVLKKVTDVSDREQVADLARAAHDNFDHVDILHNNAGVGIGGPLEMMPLEDWEKIVAINFWSVVYGVHYFLPRMIERRYGHIVNTASGAGLCGLPALGAYSATKFGVVGFSEVLRAELRRHNIGVTAICPGIINTNIVSDGKATLPEGVHTDQNKMAEFYKKYGWSPERVAKVVLKGVRKNRPVMPVGPEAWVVWYMKRISLRLHDFILTAAAKSSLKIDR